MATLGVFLNSKSVIGVIKTFAYKVGKSRFEFLFINTVLIALDRKNHVMHLTVEVATSFRSGALTSLALLFLGDSFL